MRPLPRVGGGAVVEDAQRAQFIILGFVGGLAVSTPAAGLTAEFVRSRFWVFAPNSLELETLTVGELAAFLEQAMGEAGVAREEHP